MAERIDNRPKVGISVLVTSPRYPGSVLMGLRKGESPGSGKYALPGGHLEFGEEWAECAQRETFEETGLTLKNVQLCTVFNAVEIEENYHYVDIFMRGEIDDNYQNEAENREPDKCEGWMWVPWKSLPPDEKLFCALRMARQSGLDPFSICA